MSFLSAYQSRFSTQLRTNWSRPQDSVATTPNTALETLAAADVDAEFKKRGITPDDTVDTHVTTGIGGIKARLMMYTGHPGWEEEWTRFTDDLKLLAETTSRDRIQPSTDSLLNPTRDVPNGVPATDRTHFKGYIPGATGDQNRESPMGE